MLSYRHSFHAGNHADVLKHTVQSLIIESLKEKEKPFHFRIFVMDPSKLAIFHDQKCRFIA